MAKNTGRGWANRPWLLGVKLEGENWFEPVLNVHTLPSPTLTQFLLFAPLHLSSTRTSWVENIRRNWLGGGAQMSPTPKLRLWHRAYMRSVNNSINWTALLERELRSITLGFVGVVTCCRLEGSGFEHLQEAEVFLFFFTVVPTGPRALPASCTVGTITLSRGWSDRGVELTSHPYLALRLRLIRAISLFPPCSCVACYD